MTGKEFYEIYLPKIRDEIPRHDELGDRCLQLTADGRSVVITWVDSEQKRNNESLLKSSNILKNAKMSIVVESGEQTNNIKRPVQALVSFFKSLDISCRPSWPLQFGDPGDSSWPSWSIHLIPKDAGVVKDIHMFKAIAAATTENGTTQIYITTPILGNDGKKAEDKKVSDGMVKLLQIFSSLKGYPYLINIKTVDSDFMLTPGPKSGKGKGKGKGKNEGAAASSG